MAADTARDGTPGQGALNDGASGEGGPGKRLSAAPAPSPAEVAAAIADEASLDLAPPVTAERVGGGYSWRTYVLTGADGRRAVARVAPPGGTMSPYDPAAEARALTAAGGAVPAPPVLAVVEVPNALDAPYGVHGFAAGEVRRLSRVADADRPAHRRAFATALGRLHAAADAAVLDPGAAAGTTAEALRRDLAATVAAFARGAPCRHPGFTIGIRWLLTHVPHVADPPRLCHGDFRLHNLAWEGTEVAAVLDWERAWVGDPMVDVAFTRRFSGWCAVDGDVVADYEAAAGFAVDEARVAYGDRYEWVRSTTSGVRGWKALADGRDDALPLYAIGEAGWAGMWAMVALLDDGPLAAAPADGLDDLPHPAFTPQRLAQIASLARGEGPAALADHLDGIQDADRASTAASVAALRALVGAGDTDVTRGLLQALDHPDDGTAWDRAHAVLSAAATTGGAELVAPLLALGRRHTDRATLLPTAVPPAGVAPGATSASTVGAGR